MKYQGLRHTNLTKTFLPCFHLSWLLKAIEYFFSIGNSNPAVEAIQCTLVFGRSRHKFNRTY